MAGAEVDLGVLYEYGQGVPHDSAKAAALYRKAGLQGNTLGARYLASAYLRGQGVPRDEAQSVL